MTEAVNQYFKELMHKKLSGTPDSKAVVGWFFEDATSVATHGDFGLKNPETMSFQIGSITKLFTATLSSVFHDNGTLLSLFKLGVQYSWSNTGGGGRKNV